MPHSGGNSDGCLRGGDTSSSRSLRCWQRCLTTRTPRWTPQTPPYGDRRLAPAPRWALPSFMSSLPTGEERPEALLAAGRSAATRRHRVRTRPESRCSCAARGGPAAERPPVLRHVSAGGCRAGYRRAQDLTGQDSAALGGLSASTADGGPAGGSAHDRFLCFSTAAHSCSSWSRRSWRRRRSSRVTTRTGFNSTYSGADR